MTDDDDIRVTRIRPVPSPPKSSAADVISDLKEMFGGGGGGGGGGRRPSRGGSGSQTPLIVGGALFLFVIWAAFTSFYTVDVNEEAVVTRFGRYLDTTPSGLHFKLPFGIDKVTKVKSKVVLQQEFGFRTVDTSGQRTTYNKEQFKKESLMLTGDLNVADVEWVVQYRISDPWKFLFHAVDVNRNIRDVSMSVMRRVVGDRLVTDVITSGRADISDEAMVLSQELLDKYDLGIQITQIVLQDVTPPERVKEAFNEVNSAKQEQEQTINNAERSYNKVIPEARGKAEQLVADAEAYAVDIVNRAKGDADQFEQVVTEYKKAPEVTRSRLYLETMETVFSEMQGFTIVDDEVKGLLPIFNQSGKPITTSKAE